MRHPLLETFSDADLVVEARKGNRDCFEVLLKRYLPLLTGFLKYLGARDSMLDDLVQETTIKVIQSLESYDPSRKFISWMATIGRNTYIDELRKRKINPVHLYEEPVSLNSVEETVLKRDSLHVILANLPPAAKFLLEMRVIKDYSFDEIAELTGENVGALRVRFHRMINHLREMRDKEDQNV